MSEYQQQLDEKLKAARKRVRQGREIKALKKAAPTLFEIMDEEISLALNRMNGAVPLSRDEYLSEHGKVAGIKRIRNLIDSKEVEEPMASKEVATIQGQQKQFTDDKKTS